MLELRKIIKEELIRNNIIFFIGSMLIAFLNYLYYPVLGRMMQINDFGEAQTIISLFLQLCVIFQVLLIMIINIWANIDDENEKFAVIAKLKGFFLYLIGGIFFVILLAGNWLKRFFHFASAYPFLCLGFLLLAGLFYTFAIACLQSKKDFKSISIAGIISSGFRLIFAVFFVHIGWKAFGAIAGLAIAELLALGYASLKVKSELALKNNFLIKINKNRIIKELKFGLLVFIVIISVAFLYSSDIILIKHFFSPQEAGFYSGIATIARIVFFISGSAAGVLLPSIKIKNARENFKILLKSLAIVVALSGILCLIFLAFPALIIRMLIGKKYLPFAFLLPKLSIALFLTSIINILFYYYLALRKYFLSVIGISGFLAVLVLSCFFHKNLSQIINNFLISNIFILVFLGVWRLIEYFIVSRRLIN